ncbi:hypothetical protein [Emticicia aquatica]|uniref:hypothetical protein n=1 Tax=Emticicia aquatica TaxID=1681835 RepID=UPI001EEA9DEC|nr:hypothetical protein [Emticicia aquatica]
MFAIFFLFLSTTGFSQKNDSLKYKTTVSGAFTATNNGISVIPTFMLGKPATIFDLTIRKKRFSFEPQFRFAIQDFKPWSFIFWLRYKLVDNKKLKIGVGAHPSTVFGNTAATVNGVAKDLITVRRFWASEISPTYLLSKNVSVGIYYLYSRGLADATKNTNFVALSGNFSNIKIANDISLRVSPQIYYLQMDTNHGYYVTSAFTLTKKKLPLAIQSIVNKKIQSTIPSKDFVWNVSLIYSY